jgi:signal peptidase II
MTSRQLGLMTAAGALAADQGSKLFLLYGLGFAAAPDRSIPLLPFFNLVMVWNSGVSYGLLAAAGWGRWLLVALALAAVVGLGWLLWQTASRILAIGYGLVIGGAIGNNLIDRVIYGRVADFFHFYALGHDWYVFNIADIAITLGAVAIVYEVIKPPALA